MPKQTPVEVSGIWLRRIGEKIIVSVEVNEAWYDVITETDGNYSHIVEPNGIRIAIREGKYAAI